MTEKNKETKLKSVSKRIRKLRWELDNLMIEKHRLMLEEIYAEQKK